MNPTGSHDSPIVPKREAPPQARLLMTCPSMDLEFSIYFASKSRWAHLTKVIPLPVVPRVGEFVKFETPQLLDYVAWEITQVTYREKGVPELMTELLDNIDGRGYSFEDEDEFDEYYAACLQAGWECSRGPTKNTRIREQRHEDARG